jgi:hypothetical protein
MELEEVVKLLVEREGWENVCVVCCSFSFEINSRMEWEEVVKLLVERDG